MALADEIGVVAWYSLMTKDVAASNQYYTQLLGLGVEEFTMPDGQSVPLYTGPKGPYANPVPLDGDDIPTHWITYFAVADVDESCKQAAELGGTVCVPAFDLPSVGRTAVVTDPAGAAFHVFTPEDKDSAVNVMGGEPGQVCWLEMMLDDPATVSGFYASLLDWTIQENPMGDAGPEGYLIGKKGDVMVAGMMKRPDGVPATPPAWMPYFMVDSLDDSVAKAKGLGGTVLVEPMTMPGIGSFALLQDPVGGVSYLFQGEAEG